MKEGILKFEKLYCSKLLFRKHNPLLVLQGDTKQTRLLIETQREKHL